VRDGYVVHNCRMCNARTAVSLRMAAAGLGQ
jgi:hypothetical protein